MLLDYTMSGGVGPPICRALSLSYRSQFAVNGQLIRLAQSGYYKSRGIGRKNIFLMLKSFEMLIL